MTNAIEYAQVFASPYGGETAAIGGAVAAGRLNRTRSLIADALASVGQKETAQAMLGFESGNAGAWRPETGLALLAHRNGSNDLAALQLAAAYAGMGGSGAVRSFIAVPGWLYLDGWLTAVDGQCTLTCDGRAISIESDLGRVEYGIRDGNRWVPAKLAAGPWVAHASGGLAPRYVTVTGLRHSVEGFPWICEKPLSAAAELPEETDPRIQTIHQAWEIILEHAPIFGLWIASSLEGCLLLDRGDGQVAQSGSSFDHPGLIAIAPPECRVFCGELLVHECSHQQLLIYSMIAPTVKAGSTEMCYSPIKRAHRPIDRVLTGAHAVGNILLYYAALRRTTKLNRTSQERFDLHSKWFVDDYRAALNGSEDLTETGRALWASLCVAVEGAMKQ